MTSPGGAWPHFEWSLPQSPSCYCSCHFTHPLPPLVPTTGKPQPLSSDSKPHTLPCSIRGLGEAAKMCSLSVLHSEAAAGGLVQAQCPAPSQQGCLFSQNKNVSPPLPQLPALCGGVERRKGRTKRERKGRQTGRERGTRCPPG